METPKKRRLRINIDSVLYNENYWKVHCNRLCDPDVVSYIKETDPSIRPDADDTSDDNRRKAKKTYIKVRALEVNYNNCAYKIIKLNLKNHVYLNKIFVERDVVVMYKYGTFCLQKFGDNNWTELNPSYFTHYQGFFRLHIYKDIFAIAVDKHVFVYKHSNDNKNFTFLHDIDLLKQYRNNDGTVTAVKNITTTFCDKSVVSILILNNNNTALMAWNLETRYTKGEFFLSRFHDSHIEQITEIYFLPKYCEDTLVINLEINRETSIGPVYLKTLIVFDLYLFLVSLKFDFPLYTHCLYFDGDTFALNLKRNSRDTTITVHNSTTGIIITSKLFHGIYPNRESAQVVNEHFGFLTRQSQLYILNKFTLDIIVRLELMSSEGLRDTYQLLQHNLFAYSNRGIVKIRRIAKDNDTDLYELKKFRGEILSYKKPVDLYILNTARRRIYVVKFL